MNHRCCRNETSIRISARVTLRYRPNTPALNSRKTEDGTRWSHSESLGGQLQGLPTAIYIHGGNKTLVFGRGAHDKLRYCQRNGTGWQEWQSLGDDLTGDPAGWEESLSGNGEGLISCMVLRQNGELWLRELQLTMDEYTERKLII
jgi:hypothetical protein